MKADIINYIEENKQKFLDELSELLKIPSISAIEQHKNDCVDCANKVAHYLKEAGADKVEVYETKGNPIVYGEKIVDKNKPTVLVYGHYDVQPIDPIELWNTPPFEPTIKENKIFCRGASDDKGQMFMHIKVLEIFNKLNNFPTNIKFLIEGEEEVGCINIENFVPKNKGLLKSDVVLVSDTDLNSLNNPSIEVGLRGLSYIEIEVTSANKDLHSGVYGGAVANPILILTKMLASLHDKDNKVSIPGFYKNVKKQSASERSLLNKVPFSLDEYKKKLKIKKDWGEKNYTTIERIGIRPTLEINGIWGGYTGDGAKTVLPSKAFAKISCRLVQNQSSYEITHLLETHLKKIAPEEVTVKIKKFKGGQPYTLPINSVEFKAASKSFEKGLNKTPHIVMGGGSIPIVASFKKHLGVNSVLLGMGLDDDNLHSPNEKFNLKNFYKGIEIISYFHHFYSELKAKKINE